MLFGSFLCVSHGSKFNAWHWSCTILYRKGILGRISQMKVLGTKRLNYLLRSHRL